MGRSEHSGDFLRRLYTPRHDEYGRAILTGFWGSGGAFEVLLVCSYLLGRSEVALHVCAISSKSDAEVYEKVLEDHCPAGKVERNCLCNIGDVKARPGGAPRAANAFWYWRKYLLGDYVTTRMWLSQGLASVPVRLFNRPSQKISETAACRDPKAAEVENECKTTEARRRVRSFCEWICVPDRTRSRELRPR